MRLPARGRSYSTRAPRALVLPVVLCAATAAYATAPGDRIEYNLGGVMSGPVAIVVDLATGNASNTQPIYSTPRSSRTVTGRLVPGAIARLEAAARTAIAAGLERQRCLAANRPGSAVPAVAPTMDAIPDLRITLDGRTTAAPAAITCWSNAADAFRDTLMAVVPR